ncbi:ferritin-like domain-containing protein [Alkaliflexus imshenetskii]|uniref:ferritin-like domain-containing protein n=1 Tax=Alkaliflexus imshenetskii TaxID=286730 RepID=UPI0004797A5D|nr:PA2169 family four-helix-bundle protein [Alkaliflexus imshenetskii]
MKNVKAVDVLNTLITINNDRIEGYETASKETDETDLKTLFSQFIETSRRCKQELVKEVNTLGGEVATGTKVSGKFFRAWMDVKSALTGKDRKTILSSCEYGEEQARDTYEKVLENDSEYLSSKQQTMIIQQKSMLIVDQNHLKALKNSLVKG